MRLVIALIALVLGATPAAASAQLDRTGLKLTFRDEFDTFRWVDPRLPPEQQKGVWRTWHPFGANHDNVLSRTFPDNEEMQLYVDPSFPEKGKYALSARAVSVKDGVLRLRAEKQGWTMRHRLYNRPYSSAMISSWGGGFSQKYGVFEMRAKVPAGQGLWPAFWLLPVNSGGPPELDVMEVIGHEPDVVHMTVHSNATGKRTGQAIAYRTVDVSQDFHVYGVEWTPREVIFYFNEVEAARFPTPPDMHRPMYLIANLAVGGKWPGAPDKTTKFPAVMEIDWIRAYQRVPPGRGR